MTLKSRIARLENAPIAARHDLIAVETEAEARQVSAAARASGRSALIVITGVPRPPERQSIASIMAHVAEHGSNIHDRPAGPISKVRVYHEPL